MPSSTASCTTLTGSRLKETACERSQPNDPVLTPHQRCDPMNMPTGQYCPPSIGMVAAFNWNPWPGSSESATKHMLDFRAHFAEPIIAGTLAGRQPAAGFGLLLHRPEHAGR